MAQWWTPPIGGRRFRRSIQIVPMSASRSSMTGGRRIEAAELVALAISVVHSLEIGVAHIAPAT
jgi:hypothetical protein